MVGASEPSHPGGGPLPLASLLIARTSSPLVRESRLTSLAHRGIGAPRTRQKRSAHPLGSAAERQTAATLEWSCDEDPPAWSRAYLGYADRFRDDYRFDCERDGQTYTMHIAQAPVASAGHSAEARASSDGGLSTGSTVWDAGIVLARYAATLPRAGERCILLELGSGTGHAGLAASALCEAADGRLAAVILTDLPTVLHLLETNIERNRHALPPGVRTAVAPYRWGDRADLAQLRASIAQLETTPGAAARAGRARAVCIGGDLLYRQEVVQPLVQALVDLLLPPPQAAGVDTGPIAAEAVVSASMEHCPDAVTQFVAAARTAGLCVAQVPYDELDPAFRSRSVVVLRCVAAVPLQRKRP
jgi:predicted nicotinamide N-methyase